MTEQPPVSIGILIMIIVGGFIALIGFILAKDHRKKDARYGNGYKNNAPPPGCLKQIIGLIMLLVGLAIAAIGLSIANPPMPTDGAQQKIGKNTEVETQQDQMNKAMNFKPPSNRSELIINSKR